MFNDSLMFDILCFFFVYLPVMSMIRGRKTQSPLEKAMVSGAVAVAVVAYFAQHLYLESKTLRLIFRAT